MPEVSIIVPVYKVEKYLDRCIESLIAQTLSDIEIILVDDGSPDNCPSLCDRWAKKDSRIKVIHKENGGLGFARNSGLDIACGEYVGFVDSDDFVKHDMYEALYSAAKNEDADIAMCGFLCIGGIMTARSGEEREINCFSEYKCFSGKDGIDRLMLDISGALPGEPEDSRYGFSTVKNIYRRSILEENRLRFMSEREVVSEDVFFLLDFLMLSNRAVGIKGAYYCYCRNQGSLSKSYRPDRFQMCCRITDGINERLGKRMSEDIYRIYTDRLFQAYARAALMQEIQFADQNKLTGRQLNERLKVICRSERLRATLKRYPWHRLPFAQAVFAMTMRFSAVRLQRLLIKLKSRG